MTFLSLKAQIGPRHRYLGGLVIIGSLTLIATYILYGVFFHPFSNTADATTYAQIGFKLNNPELYQQDIAITIWSRDVLTVFFFLLPDAWEQLGVVGTSYVALSLAFGLLFGLGVFLLIDEIFERPDIAFIAALVAMLASRGLMQTPVGWGPRIITPRFVIFGLSPLLLWLYWRWRHSWRVSLLFFVLALLLALHPRFPVYPAAIMGLGLLIQQRPSWQHWGRVLLVSSPFAVGLLVIVWISIQRLGNDLGGGGGVMVELPAYNLAGLLRQLFFSAIGGVVPFGLALLGWLNHRRHQKMSPSVREAWLTFTLIPLGLYVLVWIGIQFLPTLNALNSKRFLSWAYLLPYAYAGLWITQLWQNPSWLRRAVAIVAVLALVFVTYTNVRNVLLTNNPLYRQAVDIFYERFAPTEIQSQNELVQTRAAQADPLQEDWDSFHALCDWARTETDIDAVFVTPPANFALFRLYSQRSLYTSNRNLGLGSMYAETGNILWDRYQAAVSAYRSADPDDFQALATLGTIDYIVVERAKLVLPLEPVYQNQRYLVYPFPENP